VGDGVSSAESELSVGVIQYVGLRERDGRNVGLVTGITVGNEGDSVGFPLGDNV